MFSFCNEIFYLMLCFKYDDPTLSISKYQKNSVSRKSTFHSLNAVNFTRIVELTNINTFVTISNEMLLSVIYNMKCEELHFFRVYGRKVKSRRCIIAKA